MRRRGFMRTLWAGSATLLPIIAAGMVSCDNEHGVSSRKGPLASTFPGAGAGAAGFALAVGTATVECTQPGPAASPSKGPAPRQKATRECYYDADHATPAATMEWIVESAAEGDLIHARLTFNPWFCDNTYGSTAIGWGANEAPPMPPAGGAPPPPAMHKPKGPKGHTFKDLVGSDHAEFTLSDVDGKVMLKFKADYLSESADAPSGYRSLGVWGGEGKMITGSADAVVAVSTSLDRDLNACGYAGYTTDSPATDDDYAVNPDAPDWDYRVVYDVWVKQSAFPAGFGRASVEFVHASPSKTGENSIDVTHGDCPPNWPPYCRTPSECKDLCGDDPDELCTAYPPCEGEGCPSDADAGKDLCGDDPDELCTAYPPCEGEDCPADAGVGTVF